jgi:hypothetical protein
MHRGIAAMGDIPMAQIRKQLRGGGEPSKSLRGCEETNMKASPANPRTRYLFDYVSDM